MSAAKQLTFSFCNSIKNTTLLRNSASLFNAKITNTLLLQYCNTLIFENYVLFLLQYYRIIATFALCGFCYNFGTQNRVTFLLQLYVIFVTLLSHFCATYINVHHF